MAREVKGRRANKPNDSFGTTNEKSLYRGKYRDDVYRDEEDKQEEQQAQEQDTEQAATPKQDAGDSFAPTQKKETQEKNVRTNFREEYNHQKLWKSYKSLKNDILMFLKWLKLFPDYKLKHR